MNDLPDDDDFPIEQDIRSIRAIFDAHPTSDAGDLSASYAAEVKFFEDLEEVDGEPIWPTPWTAERHREVIVLAAIERNMRAAIVGSEDPVVGTRLRAWLAAGLQRCSAAARVLIDSVAEGARTTGNVVVNGLEFLQPSVALAPVAGRVRFSESAESPSRAMQVVSSDARLLVEINARERLIRVVAVKDPTWEQAPLVALVALEDDRTGAIKILENHPQIAGRLQATFAAEPGNYVVLLESARTVQLP